MPQKEVILSILGSGLGMRDFSKWSVRHTILDYNEHSSNYWLSPWEHQNRSLHISLRRKKIENDRVERIRVLASGRQKY